MSALECRLYGTVLCEIPPLPKFHLPLSPPSRSPGIFQPSAGTSKCQFASWLLLLTHYFPVCALHIPGLLICLINSIGHCSNKSWNHSKAQRCSAIGMQWPFILLTTGPVIMMTGFNDLRLCDLRLPTVSPSIFLTLADFQQSFFPHGWTAVEQFLQQIRYKPTFLQH